MIDNAKVGWNQYFRPTPANVEKFLLGLKGFLGILSTYSYVKDHSDYAFFILVFGAFIDWVCKYIGQVPQAELVDAAAAVLHEKVEDAKTDIKSEIG